MTASRDLIDRVHDAAFASIARKVKDGKALTAPELRAISDMKKQCDRATIQEARSIIESGLKVMAMIRDVVEDSKLASTDKKQIIDAILSIDEECTT